MILLQAQDKLLRSVPVKWNVELSVATGDEKRTKAGEKKIKHKKGGRELLAESCGQTQNYKLQTCHIFAHLWKRGVQWHFTHWAVN